jgi:hypothetical protein
LVPRRKTAPCDSATDERLVDQLQIGRAIGGAARQQRLEGRELVVGASHHDLPAAFVRHAVSGAELVEPLGSLDAQLRLQGAAGIVEPRVDDAAVVGAGFHPRPGMAFDDTDCAAVGGQPAGSGEPGDAAADD